MLDELVRIGVELRLEKAISCLQIAERLLELEANPQNAQVNRIRPAHMFFDSVRVRVFDVVITQLLHR